MGIYLWVKESLVSLFSVTDAKCKQYDQMLRRLDTEKKSTELYRRIANPQNENILDNIADLSVLEFSDSFEKWFKESKVRTARSVAVLSDVRAADWFFYRLTRWALRTITGYETTYGHYLKRAETEVQRHLSLLGRSREIMEPALERFEAEIRDGVSNKKPYKELAQITKPISLLMLQREGMCTDLVETLQNVDGVVHRVFRWMGSMMGQTTAFGGLVGRAKRLQKEARDQNKVVSGWSKAVSLEIYLAELQTELDNDSRTAREMIEFFHKVDRAQKQAVELAERHQTARKEEHEPSWYDQLGETAYKLTSTVSIVPKGIPNQGNTCYIASALQLLSQASLYGCSENFGDAPLQPYSYVNADGVQIQMVKESDIPDQAAVRDHVRPAIDQLAVGHRFNGVYELTRKLFESKAKVTDAPVGTQGCALEVFENVWDYIQASALFCERQKALREGVEPVLIPGYQSAPPSGLDKKDKEMRRMLTCCLDDQANTLNEVLRLELQGEIDGLLYTDSGQVYSGNVTIKKTLDVEALPRLLPIGFKRTGWQDGYPVKRTQEVDVPDYWEVPGEFLSDDSASVAYRLVGFIRHWDDNGSTDEGHYTAYLKRGPLWYHADDCSVTRVSERERLKEQGQGILYLFERIA